MKIAYFECSSGISGDMCLGALVHAGVGLDTIKTALRAIPLKGYTLGEKKVKCMGLEATRVEVKITSSASGRAMARWKHIEAVVKASTLKPEVKRKGLGILKSMFIAEAVVHGEPYDRLHLHELGSADTLVDVFGTLIGLDALGIEKVIASPVNLGSGTIKTLHGTLPVPAPATVELLKGLSSYTSETPYELTTPTGAAILKGVSSGTGAMPDMSIERIGIGAGRRQLKDRPNILRVFMGEAEGANEPGITVIETNIDDMNPQLYGYVLERLLGKGALDAFLTPVVMKKGRPGIKLTVLCPEDKVKPLADIIFKETTTIGLRFYKAGRVTLKRQMEKIDTDFGKIRVKRAYTGDGMLKSSPEYEDCRRAAARHNVSLLRVLEEVKRRLSSE